MKKWKWVLLVIGIIILGTGGSIYYYFEMKNYDIAEDIELNEITEADFEIVLPDQNDEVVTESLASDSKDTDANAGIDNQNEDTTSENALDQTKQNHSTNDSTEAKGATNDSSNSSPSKNENNNPSNTPAKKATVVSIKNKYSASFESLEDQANSKLAALGNKAISEYKEKKANNEEVSFGYFYAKYSEAGKKLEQKTNTTFEVIYNALENDLKKHGYSTTHAEEIRAAYESAKKARRAAIMNKALEYL